jgi:hypothetical protein
MTWRPKLATLAVLAACWPVWEASAWLVGQLAPGIAELLLRTLCVFLFLGLAEQVLTRLAGDPHV